MALSLSNATYLSQQIMLFDSSITTTHPLLISKLAPSCASTINQLSSTRPSVPTSITEYSFDMSWKKHFITFCTLVYAAYGVVLSIVTACGVYIMPRLKLPTPERRPIKSRPPSQPTTDHGHHDKSSLVPTEGCDPSPLDKPPSPGTSRPKPLRRPSMILRSMSSEVVKSFVTIGLKAKEIIGQDTPNDSVKSQPAVTRPSVFANQRRRWSFSKVPLGDANEGIGGPSNPIRRRWSLTSEAPSGSPPLRPIVLAFAKIPSYTSNLFNSKKNSEEDSRCASEDSRRASEETMVNDDTGTLSPTDKSLEVTDSVSECTDVTSKRPLLERAAYQARGLIRNDLLRTFRRKKARTTDPPQTDAVESMQSHKEQDKESVVSFSNPWASSKTSLSCDPPIPPLTSASVTPEARARPKSSRFKPFGRQEPSSSKESLSSPSSPQASHLRKLFSRRKSETASRMARDATMDTIPEMDESPRTGRPLQRTDSSRRTKRDRRSSSPSRASRSGQSKPKAGSEGQYPPEDLSVHLNERLAALQRQRAEVDFQIEETSTLLCVENHS